MRDDDEPKPTPDSDRAAILARRKQFIAIALSGLTTAAACTDGKNGPGTNTKPGQEQSKDSDKEPPPQPCLNVVAHPPEQPEAPPQPCLEIQAPPEQPEPPPEVPPGVCLKFSRPPTEDPYETAKPQPCLKVAPPD